MGREELAWSEGVTGKQYTREDGQVRAGLRDHQEVPRPREQWAGSAQACGASEGRVAWEPQWKQQWSWKGAALPPGTGAVSTVNKHPALLPFSFPSPVGVSDWPD